MSVTSTRLKKIHSRRERIRQSKHKRRLELARVKKERKEQAKMFKFNVGQPSIGQDPLVDEMTHDQEVKEQIQKNLEILKALEEEYDKEQAAREESAKSTNVGKLTGAAVVGFTPNPEPAGPTEQVLGVQAIEAAPKVQQI